MIHFNGLTPMLWSNDLAATILFYGQTLGFTLDEYNETWGWCHLHKDDVALMFARPNEHEPYNGKPVCTGSFYIYTDEVDALWEKLKTQCTIGYAIGNFPHNMREFAIYDNNGYMLQFGRELAENEAVDEWEE